MNTTKNRKMLPIIGSTEYVSVGRSGSYKNIPAKIDTGADSSSIWASNVKINKNHELEFTLFDEKSPYFIDKVIKRKDYKVAIVRSATGEEQLRYRTHLQLKVAGKTINALFNLSDRSRNNFPILIGRRSLTGKFLVDTSLRRVATLKKTKTKSLNTELKKDPHKFYLKHKKAGLAK